MKIGCLINIFEITTSVLRGKQRKTVHYAFIIKKLDVFKRFSFQCLRGSTEPSLNPRKIPNDGSII